MYGFTYPPFAAMVMGPLAFLSWPVAVAAWITGNVICLVLLLHWFLPENLSRNLKIGALALLALFLFEPVRDTFSYAQVNLFLLLLVVAGLRYPRWAGVGIGLAAAIKLTPAVFIGYLLLSRQYRAAAVAAGTAVGATAIAAILAPHLSRTFWTEALWDTNRVGHTYIVSNQSLRGVVDRLEASSPWWLLSVALVVVCWAWWVRKHGAADPAAALALTGLLSCLISPISWVHHLVWLLPAFFLLLDRSIGNPKRLGVLAALYVVMCSSLPWLWWDRPIGWDVFLGVNAYVWVTLALGGLLVTSSVRAGRLPEPAFDSLSP
ncbi:membrane protein [Actinoplanes sp. OR16]|nr:membrane protein [Actinoplanes sp. OR16]